MKSFIYKIIPCLILVSTLQSCSKEPTHNDLLIGSWRNEVRRTHHVLTFRANGSWKTESRIEGRFSKVVKRTPAINGKWEMVENRIAMVANEDSPQGKWEKEKRILFEIIELTPEILILKDPSEKMVKWLRIKSSQKKKVEIKTVELGPIVVNLRKKKKRSADRYICINLGIALNISEAENEESIPTFHPRVREAAIFHLSSLTYNDVNKLAKINDVKKDLQYILNPYVVGGIKELLVQKVIVTSSKETVEEFLGGVSSEEEIEEDIEKEDQTEKTEQTKTNDK